MTEHAEKKMWNKQLEGIKSLKKELLVRLALMQHTKTGDPQIDLAVNLRQVDRELEDAYVKVRQCESGSPEEDACLARIRELEDERFKVMSAMNGDRISAYTAISPK